MAWCIEKPQIGDIGYTPPGRGEWRHESDGCRSRSQDSRGQLKGPRERCQKVRKMKTVDYLTLLNIWKSIDGI